MIVEEWNIDCCTVEQRWRNRGTRCWNSGTEMKEEWNNGTNVVGQWNDSGTVEQWNSDGGTVEQRW